MCNLLIKSSSSSSLLAFSNQACAAGVHLVSWNYLCLQRWYVCVCVCPDPQGYILHSRDIEPVLPVEQVCYVMKLNEAILHMGVAIVTKHTVTEKAMLVP